jgi:hypothetical protein
MLLFMCFVKTYSADLLFPECCHEFHLSKLELLEKYVVEENALHHDQEINDSHYDNLSDAFDIISNTSTVVSCHEDQIFLFENSEYVEQADVSVEDSLKPAIDSKDNFQFLIAAHMKKRMMRAA